MRSLVAIGLMSGTSMDGVDAAIIRTDGERIEKVGPGLTRPYDSAERAAIRAALAAAADLDDRYARPPALVEAERTVTDVHVDAVTKLLDKAGLHGDDVDIVGFHGQTVLHAPERKLTIQIGNAEVLSAAIGIAVVYDFRAADIAAGGEGAPFVPVYHRALAERDALPRPLAVVNLGGVANITWIGRDGRMIACDTGPASAMIDDWVRSHTGRNFDEGGRIASAGAIDETALARLLDHPYFGRAAPKSLDRDAFSGAPIAKLSLEDGAATLTAFSARALAKGLELMPERPELLVLCGGGAHNRALVAEIGRVTAIATIKTAGELGWSGDFVEAEAFGFMAVRRMRFLPLSFPTTTGVAAATLGGQLARPRGAGL